MFSIFIGQKSTYRIPSNNYPGGCIFSSRSGKRGLFVGGDVISTRFLRYLYGAQTFNLITGFTFRLTFQKLRFSTPYALTWPP